MSSADESTAVTSAPSWTSWAVASPVAHCRWRTCLPSTSGISSRIWPGIRSCSDAARVRSRWIASQALRFCSVGSTIPCNTVLQGAVRGGGLVCEIEDQVALAFVDHDPVGVPCATKHAVVLQPVDQPARQADLDPRLVRVDDLAAVDPERRLLRPLRRGDLGAGEPAQLGEQRFLHAGRRKPPSTTRTWPRTISASGEQRKTTAFAMSSAVTSRPAGVRFSPHSSICSFCGKYSSASVSTTPPETAFTRIPRGANSTAR